MECVLQLIVQFAVSGDNDCRVEIGGIGIGTISVKYQLKLKIIIPNPVGREITTGNMITAGRFSGQKKNEEEETDGPHEFPDAQSYLNL